jgi:hypothetical protein
MPRPKRTKIASATAPIRVAKAPKAAVPTPTSRKATQPSHEFSDDSDGLVVKATQPRKRRPWEPAPQKDADFTMTGALPADEGERGEAVTKESSGKKRSQAGAVARGSSNRTPSSTRSRRSQASKDRAQASPTVDGASNRPADYISTQDDESSLMDPSLLTFGSLDSDSPAHGTRPPSAIKIGATPGHETSILALTNFRRRQRQPSLLRMVHQTTDVEDNNLDDFDDLDDFNPADESTPLQVQKNSVVEGASGESVLSLSSTGSRGRKRKLASPVIQVPRSSPPYDPPSGVDVVDSQRSSSPSLPEPTIEIAEEVVETQEQVDNEPMSETMAPPRSSSPVDASAEPQPRLRQRRKPRSNQTKGGDSFTDEEETVQAPKGRGKQGTKAQSVSTAKLQALLPKRRARAAQERDEYDIDASDHIETVDSDEDELHRPAPRQNSTAKKNVPKTSKKGSRAKKPTTPAVVTERTRTYGRRISSDKENEAAAADGDENGDEDETEVRVDSAPKTNLAAIAKKFEEVDAWEMEFESVDVVGGNSSPWR